MNGNLRGAFTKKEGTQSDFNMFMKLNDNAGVFFTKRQNAKAAQVIFPVQISDGKLESVIAVLQRVNGEGIPKITSSFLKLELSRDDSRRLWAVMSDYAFVNIGGYLGTDADLAAGCYTWVHSRNDGKLLISSQVLVSNNDDMIAQYSSDAQYELARNSYGTNSGNFFSSSDGDAGASSQLNK